MTEKINKKTGGLSLLDIAGEKTHRIEYHDDQLNIDCWFDCTLPSAQLKRRASKTATTFDKRGNSDIDPMKFAEGVFVPCVETWSFPEDCSDDNKVKFVQAGNPALNKIAQFVALKLFQLTESSHLLESGN